MKIDEKILIQEAIRSTKSTSKTGDGASFSESLAKATEKGASDAASVSNATGPSNILNTSPVGRILAISASGQTQAADQLEQVLGSLDSYAQAMADSSKTLKELGPLVNELEASAAKLEQVGKELPEGHPLRSTINETAVLAAVEAVKFNRGDYT